MATDTPILSYNFRESLIKLTAGYLSIDRFESIVETFEASLQKWNCSQRVENNLMRIINALFDRVYFLEMCLRYPHYPEITAAIAAHSNYLTDIIAANPEYLSWILNTGVLNVKPTQAILEKEIKETLRSHKKFQYKCRALKSLKRKYMLRIGVQDILNIGSYEDTVSELSILAQQLASTLFNLCYAETLEKNNIKTTKREYCLIALGKMGGEELNYSSDIDLMVFYDKDQNYRNGKTYREVLIEAIRLFIQQATIPDDRGTLYRIDFRLRPDGNSAPLCSTLEDHIKYYESRGEDWERMMLLKANLTAGSAKLYKEFQKRIHPFVFPLSFTQSPKEQIKRLRQMVLSSAPDQRNIKLAAGGIRDIEFPIQTLQMLSGGRYPDLRTGNTLIAMNHLVEHQLLSREEKRSLLHIYIFYRRIEHYLQLMNNLQVHTFPEEGELTESLAKFFEFPDVDAFNREVASMQESIRRFYQSVMLQEEDTVAEDMFAGVVFHDTSKALKNMEYLQFGKGLLNTRQFDKKTSDSFRIIAPVLHEYLLTSPFPDVVLDNLAGILRRTFIPSLWYEVFRNKPVFQAFLRVCEYSQKAISALNQNPSLHEFVLSGTVFEELTIENSDQFLMKEILFILSFQLTIGILTPHEVSQIISGVIRKRVLDLIVSKIAPNYDGNDYAVMFLGSLATGEMTFASDVDLLFISRENRKYPSIQDDFSSLLDDIKKKLAPFPVDCRLRPEGVAGLMVIDIPHYMQYVRQRMRVWEMQAMTKMHFATGSIELYEAVQILLEDTLDTMESSVILQEIIAMRKRIYSIPAKGESNSFQIKRSSGGLVDIEFILQYFALIKPGCFTACNGKTLQEQFAVLIKNKALKKQQADILIQNYRGMKDVEISLQNLFDISSVTMKEDTNFREKATAFYGGSGNTLFNDILERIQQNLDIFHLLMQ